MKRVLVAGIGNIFLGDDGFGCEVVRQLGTRDLPEGVDVADFGTRGMDLSYALMDGYAVAILIDTIERHDTPGTVYVIEPEIDEWQMEEGASAELTEPLIVLHEMDPAKVLRLLDSLGERRPRVLLVGCQPETLGDEAGHMGLSATVTAAIPQAVSEVLTILEDLQRDDLAQRVEKPRMSA